MFKLLTEEKKVLAEKEYHTRRIVIAFYGLALALLVAIVAMLPSYVISDSKVKEALGQKQAMEGSDHYRENEELAQRATDIRTQLELLEGTSRETLFEDIRDFILLKPAGITLHRIAWNRDGSAHTLSISGKAADRQVLVEFQRVLGESKKFTGATIPVSQFAKDRDIEFNFIVNVQDNA